MKIYPHLNYAAAVRRIGALQSHLQASIERAGPSDLVARKFQNQCLKEIMFYQKVNKEEELQARDDRQAEVDAAYKKGYDDARAGVAIAKEETKFNP
jgi:hypothetical protein